MIKNKLKSEHGATMLLALFAVLVAAAVSALLIRASASAALSHADSRESRQSALTVSSAAEMFSAGLEGDSVRYGILSDSSYNDSGAAVPEPLDSLLPQWVSQLKTTPSRSVCQAELTLMSDLLESVQVNVYLTRQQLLLCFRGGEDGLGSCMSLCFDVSVSGNLWRFENPLLQKGDLSEEILP